MNLCYTDAWRLFLLVGLSPVSRFRLKKQSILSLLALRRLHQFTLDAASRLSWLREWLLCVYSATSPVCDPEQRATFGVSGAGGCRLWLLFLVS